MAVNLVATIHRKSLTNDEKFHIPAGYYHLVLRDFQLNPEHPPLVKMLSALPLIFLKPTVPSPAVADVANSNSHDPFFSFWKANSDRIEAISFWTRVPMILLSLIFGIVVFSYTRYVAGPAAAVFAVIIFSLEPTILAHGRIVQTDVPAAFTYFLFFFVLQRFVEQQSIRRVIELGLATGLALVTKFSLVIVLPVFLIALFAIAWRQYKSEGRASRPALKIGLALAALLLLVNVVYYFERAPLLTTDREAVVREWPAHITALGRTFHVLSTIVPPSYLFGAFVVNVHNEWGHYASLLGSYSRSGWWYYFPVAFSLKTTLPVLLLSVAALIWSSWRLIRYRDFLLFLPVVAIALYTGLCMMSHINIGIRHFLPVFPFLFLLSGAFLARAGGKRLRGVMIAVSIVMLSWMALEAMRTFPDYLPYMNQLAWKQPHWYYLSDSNVEWGDDTGALAHYLLQRGETKVRAAVLGGWQSKVQYGVDFINPLVVDEPVEPTRYIAIGASYLNGSTVPLIRDRADRPITEEQRRNFFAAYRVRVPEAVFGNSIYLYREE